MTVPPNDLEPDDDEVDWDGILRASYADHLLTPSDWHRTADELQASAGLIAPRVSAYWEEVRSVPHGGDRRVRNNCHAVFMMLSAFTIENLCKGFAVSRLTAVERREIAESSRLPKRLRTHDLVSLARATGFEPDEPDERLLRRLQRAGIWHGRYPVAVDYDSSLDYVVLEGEEPTSLTYLAGRDVDRTNDLVLRIREHLGVPHFS